MSTKTFDFIVVGAGAGGGPLACNLAKAGYRVLLLEAGGDQAPPSSKVPAFHLAAAESEEISWDFRVRQYQKTQSVEEGQPPDDEGGDACYPRASGLGGCTLHNAMITMSGPADDWDAIAWLTGDRTWNSTSMRSYFEQIENCHHVRNPDTGWFRIVRLVDALNRVLGRDCYNRGRHGFKGWLDTTVASPRLIAGDLQLLLHVGGAVIEAMRAQLLDVLLLIGGALLGNVGSLFDPNHWERLRDRPEGLRVIPCAIRKGQRRSVRDLIVETRKAYPEQLTIWTDTLVTEVMWAENQPADSEPVATGVRFLKGKHLYRAHAKAGDSQGEPGYVCCEREVILCGGAFNTPQLLMLSGVGPIDHLTELGIKVRVDLPGVGTNLQDRYELGVVWEMEREFSLLRGLKFGADGMDDDGTDPALSQWLKDQTGLYATNGIILAVFKKSNPGLTAADLCMLGFPGKFTGYAKGFSKAIATKNAFTWVVLKANTKNRGGTVRLSSKNPLDRPDINFAYFSDGTDVEQDDLNAMVAGIRFVRRFFCLVRLWPRSGREVIPGESKTTDDDLRRVVQRASWGHHASCSCPIGPAGDRMAVLDPRFKVRGVANLRVVDASAFPNIPGVFIVANIYMMSEKASDVIVNEHSTRDSDGRRADGVKPC
jgi:choline dehydrogenase-like flavoprotein